MIRIADTRDASSDYDTSQPSSFQVDTSDIIGILRRGWYKILIPLLLGLAGSLAYIASLEPTYRASTRLIIERSATRYVQNKVSDGPGLDDADLWSLVHVIASESMVLPVVRSLKLTADPEFYEAPKTDASGAAAAATPSLRSRLRDLLRTRPAVASEPQAPERIALDAVNRRLSVTREEGPNVINIAFESRSPETAAKVANAIADAYLATAITSKYSVTKLATGLMQDRLTDLKTQAANAERALLEYKVANGLVGSKDRTMTTEQLNTLNSRLAEARVSVAEAKAKLDRLETAADIESKDGFTPDNELISRLRTQHLDLAARAADIESRVGKNHEAAIKLLKRMKDIRTAIASEQKRLSGSFQKDYALAQARYSEIATTLSKVMGEESSGSQTQARMRELESAAETLRTLYNGMLQRFSETTRGDTQPSMLADARIMTRASVPLRQEVSKRRFVLVGAGTLLGALLGLAWVFAREFPFGVFRTPRQLRDATGIFSTALPAISDRVTKTPNGLYQYALDAPFSRFAETIRTIGAIIKKSQDSGGKVYAVISATPQEGKTVIAANIAHLAATHGGARTLLIDTDFHRQTLSNSLARAAKVGLREAIGNPSNLSEYIYKSDHSNLDILPCPSAARIPNAAELLGSPNMRKLIESARKSYDLVIMEVAPVAAVVDFRMLAPLCDGHVFVVAWSKTSQRVIKEILADVPALAERALCTVLNKVDPRALHSIERYKGSTREYYQTKQTRAVPVPRAAA
jgi:polysaccharide biosynthesis transport protein